MLVCISAQAITVDCKPGQLRQLVGEDTGITSLTVKGSMNVTDFDFIAENLTDLNSLVINANIVEYKGDITRSGSGFSPANTIPAYALFGSNVTELTIFGSMTSIGEAALAGSSVRNLVLIAPITAIPPYFAKDSALEQLILPESVAKIEKNAFSGCKVLRTVVAQGVTSVADNAFLGCSALTDFTLSPKLETIGGYAFSGTGLSALDLTVYKALKTIGAGAFAQCPGLKTLKLPEGVTTLPEGLLLADTSLEQVTLPSTLTAVEDYAMAGLTSLNMDDVAGVLSSTSIESVGKYGIANWHSTEMLTLPASLEFLDDNAMQQWSGLKEINIPEDMTVVPELGENVWADTPQGEIKLNTASTPLAEELKNTPQWKEFIITDLNSVEGVTDDLADGITLNITFNGDDMELTCSEEMASLGIYDLAGHTLLTLTPRNTAATVNTAAWNHEPFLVRVTTAGNNVIAKKIICK